MLNGRHEENNLWDWPAGPAGMPPHRRPPGPAPSAPGPPISPGGRPRTRASPLRPQGLRRSGCHFPQPLPPAPTDARVQAHTQCTQRATTGRPAAQSLRDHSQSWLITERSPQPSRGQAAALAGSDIMGSCSPRAPTVQDTGTNTDVKSRMKESNLINRP